MKKVFTVLAIGVSILGISTTSNAQSKIGYISTEDLIGAMPEAKSADSILQDYQASLEMQRDEYIMELNEKDSIFIADSSKMTAGQKELKRNDLFALYQKVQNWNQTMQQMIGEKNQVLVGPIRKKASDAIKAVAKANGYGYILDANTLIVMPPADDILPLVKKQLGIKDPAPAKAPVKTGAGQ
ncbi:OmpH family outer membrane protein [Ferruginibacter sp. SUN002]|uniref:OmpH family outer membrane protein n=1 Tax=Ferruginibacter sp. SUN002 TaxID=2937789 RepID=UPI003D35BB0D